MTEIDNIIRRYNRRETNGLNKTDLEKYEFEKFKNKERESYYANILHNLFGSSLSDCKILEIGAGEGKNINFFKQIGIPSKNIMANELISNRIKRLKDAHPDIHLLEGNALNIQKVGPFDIIMQSLVFTSILDQSFRNKLANKIFELLKPNGIILWYDFVYNNPKNPDVLGVSKNEIRYLFPGASISFYRVTLAPPIGRRIGKLYNLVNFLAPFFRTHVIAVIKKKNQN